MKINLKKTCAVLLAGGIVLTPAPSAKTLNVNTEEVRNIKTNLSYVMFCELVCNVSLYLKSFGLEISNFELSNSLYIQNIAFIDESTKEELIKNNMISDDKKILMNDYISVLSKVANYNDNLLSKALDKKKNVKVIDYIYTSKMLVDENDKEIANRFDSMLIEFINSKKQNNELFHDLMNAYTMKENDTVYKLENASLGAKTAINLTSGTVFYFQIGPTHPYQNVVIADEYFLNELCNSIYDISNVYNIMNKNVKRK